MNIFLISFALLVHSAAPEPADLVGGTEIPGTRRGAAALAWDPAAAGIAEGFELRVSGRSSPIEIGRAATSAYIVWPWESMSWLFGYDEARLGQRRQYVRSTFGVAFRLSERSALGIAWRRHFAEGVDTQILDVGFYAEPFSWLTLSLYGEQLNEPVFVDGAADSVYGAGFGLRPFNGEPWFTLGMGTRFLRKPGSRFEKTYLSSLGTYLGLELTDGVQATIAWHYERDGTHTLWAGLGLHTNIGAHGLEAEFAMGTGGLSEPEGSITPDRSHWSVTYKEAGEPGLVLGGEQAKAWIAGDTKREAAYFLARDEAVATMSLRLAALANEDTVEEVILGISDLDMGLAGVEELRAAIFRLREHGKKVSAYLSGGDEKSYLVALAADTIKVDPVAVLLLDGFSVTSRYFSGALHKIGIRFDAVTVGDYKTGPDFLTRSSSRPEDREVRGEILGQAMALLKTSIAKDRGLTPETVDKLLAKGYFNGSDAVSAGLADGLFTPFEAASLPKNIPSGFDLAAYERANPEWGSPSRVLVIPIIGTIVSKSGGSPMPGQSASAENIVPALEEAAADDRVKAVVLRVESPGGDVMASERIWRAVRRLQERKPVVVSMGQVAASGGYYVAAPAQKIFAEPNSITGSIGIFALLPDISGLYELLGIGTEIEKRGDHADWNSETHALRDDDRAALTNVLEHYYETFLDRVATGRKLKPARVREIAGGRVYTGFRAHELGLVDELGGLLEAVEAAASAANLRPKRYALAFSERALGKRSLIDLLSASREEATVDRVWEYVESLKHLSKVPLALMPQWFEVLP